MAVAVLFVELWVAFFFFSRSVRFVFIFFSTNQPRRVSRRETGRPRAQGPMRWIMAREASRDRCQKPTRDQIDRAPRPIPFGWPRRPTREWCKCKPWASSESRSEALLAAAADTAASAKGCNWRQSHGRQHAAHAHRPGDHPSRKTQSDRIARRLSLRQKRGAGLALQSDSPPVLGAQIMLLFTARDHRRRADR